MPVQRLVPVDGVSLYSRIIGQGQPLIVLHGGPDFDQRYLLPDLDRLRDAFRLIYYDQECGHSPYLECAADVRNAHDDFSPHAASQQAEEDMASLVRSLDLDPPVELEVDCPPQPAGAETVLFAGVFANQTPVLPDSPEFPADFCPAGTRFFNLAEGRGNSSVMGEFIWWERYCAGTPAGLVAEGHFEGVDGDRLDWTARIRATEDSPPAPFRTFSGTFTFTGGTGRFDGVSGEAVVAAKQLGDAAAENRPGSTAAAVCGWVTGASSGDNRGRLP